MIRHLFITLTGILLSLNSFSQNDDVSRFLYGKNTKDSFLVLKIDSYRIDSFETVYIIRAERNDSVFKIVSIKTSVNNNCKIIEPGYLYRFKLNAVMAKDFPNKRNVTAITVSGISIPLNEQGIGKIWNLFFAENLNGLCYHSP